ncbi:unnamed protein product [Effrenium voratum]|uniref:Uncharacterized protein n=1 Tax=Effrenium voratum TaxID=2562239 RepID=A0AA36IJ08_9DINO|nr:unnamed protein product [Effrenium voratum]
MPACACFAEALPLLQQAAEAAACAAEVVRGRGAELRLDEVVRRFLMVCLVYSRRMAEAIRLGEDSLARGRSQPALLRLCGEIFNQQGLQLMGLQEAEARSWFLRASKMFEEAEMLAPGHAHSFSSWALSNSMLGDLQGAQRVAGEALKTVPGFWVHPLQRPSFFAPQLLRQIRMPGYLAPSFHSCTRKWVLQEVPHGDASGASMDFGVAPVG